MVLEGHGPGEHVGDLAVLEAAHGEAERVHEGGAQRRHARSLARTRSAASSWLNPWRRSSASNAWKTSSMDARPKARRRSSGQVAIRARVRSLTAWPWAPGR